MRPWLPALVYEAQDSGQLPDPLGPEQPSLWHHEAAQAMQQVLASAPSQGLESLPEVLAARDPGGLAGCSSHSSLPADGTCDSGAAGGEQPVRAPVLFLPWHADCKLRHLLDVLLLPGARLYETSPRRAMIQAASGMTKRSLNRARQAIAQLLQENPAVAEENPAVSDWLASLGDVMVLADYPGGEHSCPLPKGARQDRRLQRHSGYGSVRWNGSQECWRRQRSPVMGWCSRCAQLRSSPNGQSTGCLRLFAGARPCSSRSSITNSTTCQR